MEQHGVRTPRLKALAQTPVIPTITLGSARTTSPVAAPVASHWRGALLRDIEGLEFSAYGVSADTGGVVVSESPSHTTAFAAGLRIGDLIQGVNGQPVREMEEFLAAMEGFPEAAKVKIIRNQQPIYLDFQSAKPSNNNP